MSGTKVNEVKLSLKLMVDTKARKVVFAEAGKDFVDFIFHLLSLPLARVVTHLKDKGMGGCLGSVFNSFQSLQSDYCVQHLNKNLVFKPKPNVIVPLLSLNDIPSGQGQGFVKAVVNYMVMDDLEVKPMTLDFLKYHAIGFDKLEEKVVEVGMKEAVEILRASLKTDAVFTTVFLGKYN